MTTRMMEFFDKFDDGIGRILRGVPALIAGSLALSIAWKIARMEETAWDQLMNIPTEWVGYISVPTGVIFLFGAALNLWGALVCFSEAFGGVVSGVWLRIAVGVAAIGIAAASFGSIMVTTGSVEMIATGMMGAH